MLEVAWSDLEGSWAQTPSAVTIGVFDGLHLGHRALIERICARDDLMPVVVTFRHHPVEILGTGALPGFITSVGQRRELLAGFGVQVAVFIDFSFEFGRLSGAEFLGHLRSSFLVRTLVVGHDFVCGHGLDTDAERARFFLEPHGTDVQVVEPVRVSTARNGEVVVSSSLIRDLIREGFVEEAGALLGRPYSLDIGQEECILDAGRTYLVTQGRLLPGSRQLVPPGGAYRGEVIDETRKAWAVELEVGRNSVSWALAERHSIRYILVKERRRI